VLLKRASHKSKRQIEEMVAELSPKPDVPPTMRKLPKRPAKANKNRIALGPELVEAGGSAVPGEKDSPTPSATTPPKPASVKPLAPARYQVQFTASAELRDKLERLRSLMRSTVPDIDLAAIVEEAVTEKIERLEAKRFGKTKNPRKSVEVTDTSPSSRHIPAAVKRAVFERDQGQCTFVDKDGHRCTERSHLEFHHMKPYGRGGDHSVGNVRLACRTHNTVWAEHDYGKETMARFKRSADRVSEPAAVYTSFLEDGVQNAWTERTKTGDVLGPERVPLRINQSRLIDPHDTTSPPH
jgi:hypothetical protein